MSTTSYQEQIVREAPNIEARKLQLLDAARDLYNAPLTLPAVEAAGLSPGQQQAADLARQGIGIYDPFLQAASQGVSQGQALASQGARLTGAIDLAPTFQSAQNLLGRGVTSAQALTPYAELAGAGLADIGAGIGRVGQAGNLLGSYLQGDVGQALGTLGAAEQAALYAAPSDFSTSAGILGGAQGTGRQASATALQAAQQPGFEQGIGALYGGADIAAKTAEAFGKQGAPQVNALGVNAPTMQAQQMTYAPDLTAPEVTAAQLNYAPAFEQYQMGPVERVQAGTFTPSSAAAYMSPYMQGVVDVQTREALRQDAIARQGRAAQAVRAGAFGGTREGVVEAEAQRNLQQRLGDIQALGLQQAYQQGSQQFNTEQQARLAAQQANQAAQLQAGGQNLAAQLGVQQLAAQTGLQTGLANLSAAQQAALANQQARLGVQQLGTQTGLQAGLANLSAAQQAAVQNQAAQLQAGGMNQQAALQAALANQQQQAQYDITGAQLGMQTAGLTQQAGQAQLGAAAQQGGLGLQAAQQMFQQAGFDAQTAMQLAQLQQTQQQQALQQSSALQGIGSLYGQTAMQQAQLGQAGLNTLANIGAQQAQLGQLPAQIASQQAGIMGQQANLYGALGQGVGALGAQQAGVDLQRASQLGALGQTIGQMGMQQATLGQAAQQLGAADVSMLMGIGQMEQGNAQAQLDAMRATQLQKTMSPYQQLAFVSDIYKGAPSSQMALTAASAPTASPLQSALGLGIAGVSAAAGAQKAGLFG